jgi:alanyl-tRNA synthetase
VCDSIRVVQNGAFVDKLTNDNKGGYVGVVLDRTNFYAESGGQVRSRARRRAAVVLFILTRNVF